MQSVEILVTPEICHNMIYFPSQCKGVLPHIYFKCTVICPIWVSLLGMDLLNCYI